MYLKFINEIHITKSPNVSINTYCIWKLKYKLNWILFLVLLFPTTPCLNGWTDLNSCFEIWNILHFVASFVDRNLYNYPLMLIHDHDDDHDHSFFFSRNVGPHSWNSLDSKREKGKIRWHKVFSSFNKQQSSG